MIDCDVNGPLASTCLRCTCVCGRQPHRPKNTRSARTRDRKSVGRTAYASSPIAPVALPPAPYAATEHYDSRTAQITILLRPLVVPGYLDAHPFVIGRKGRTLIASDKPQWAERFSDAAARVLRDALSQRLGASRVLIAGDGRIPDVDLTVEFLALDPQQGALRLDAKWSFSCTGRDRPSHGGALLVKSRSELRLRPPLLPLLRMPWEAWLTCSRRGPNV